MDWRRTLVVMLGLLTAGAGCLPSSGLPATAGGEPAPVITAKEPEPVKRQLKPSTCVALGKLSEEAAADPRCNATEQEQHRDKARRAYQQALQTDPNDLAALSSLARLYNTMGEHERAVTTYTRAIKAHPKQAPLYFDLGMCYAGAKEWEPAFACLRHAVELDPEQRRYTRFLGFCLARAGRYEESFAALVKIDGEAKAHYNLARMLHHMKEDDLCKEHLQMALRINPKFVKAQQLLTILETPGTDATRDTAVDVMQDTN